MKNIKKIALSITLLALLQGCDINKNNQMNIESNNDTIKEKTVTTVSGYLIDGYIAGATVCLDTNNNNICDEDEIKTISDSNGKYFMDISKIKQTANQTILAFGGVDTFSQLPFKGVLKSNFLNKEEINLNGISTLLSYYSDNVNYIKNRNKLAKVLNIDENKINTNIIETDKQVFMKSLKINKMLDIFNEDLSDTERNNFIKVIATLMIEQNLDEESVLNSINDNKKIVNKYNIKRIFEIINKNKNVSSKKYKELQKFIDYKIKYRDKNTDPSELIANQDFLSTLENQTVNQFLKNIDFKFDLVYKLSDEDKEFYEKLNTMNLSSSNPSFEELNNQLDTLDLKPYEKRRITRRFQSHSDL